MTKNEKQFLIESNLIEGVGEEGLEDSIKAYNYLMSIKSAITEKHILETHRLLIKTLNPRIAGKFRKVNVGIYKGNICIRKCPKPKEIKELLSDVILNINKSIKFGCGLEDKEGYVKGCHINFEEAHPFEDGNGRTGRLVYNWHRKELGLPLKIIYNKNKQNYYKWFKSEEKISEQLAEEFIKYHYKDL